jgi:hypothetical protein
MHKVVFNNCYGGFSLSLKAIEWLEKNCKDNKLKEYIVKEKAKNNSDYVFTYSISEYFEDNRHHKDLVAVVEALGEDANGDCALLAIKEIYCNQYRIDEYDGAEEVIVPDCENWIYIND